MFFPECVARVPFHSGGLGAEGVFARRCVCGRNRSQPSATVRNRPQPSVWGPYGRGKFCRRGHFWRFPTFRCFVLRDVFCNVSKIVLCGRRNTFARFSEDAWQFSWQAQHFGLVHRHFRGRRSTLDVSCWVFFANRIGRAASSGNKVQIPWKLTEASHETSILMLQNLEVPARFAWQAWHFVTFQPVW